MCNHLTEVNVENALRAQMKCENYMVNAIYKRKCMSAIKKNSTQILRKTTIQNDAHIRWGHDEQVLKA